MSKNKRKYFIDLDSSIPLFEQGYGLKVRVMNEYQIRLTDQYTPNTFWDWYHTSGTLCQTTDGQCQNKGVYTDDEIVAMFIQSQIKKLNDK